MTNEQLLQMEAGLKRILLEPIAAAKNTTKVLYAIRRNIEIVQQHTKPLRETLESMRSDVPGIKKFDEARIKLCEQYSKKDIAGTAIMINNNYQIDDEKRAEFDQVVRDLKEQHKADFDALDAINKDIEKFMKDDVGSDAIKFYRLKLDQIPDEFFDGHPERMDALYYILDAE